jgi:D-alanyl-D-alanine carboxypeptidase/D-alanyl-D-alanine-endopeptidase (penicillin-binding protein 4)
LITPSKIKLIFLLICIFIISGIDVTAQLFELRHNNIDSTNIPIVLSPIQELQNDLNVILQNNELNNANVGVVVQSVKTGDYFYKYNEAKNFVPASTLKLITTGAALNSLGNDFKYLTKIYLDGDVIENGEFKGNIIIKGFGDPTLSDNFKTDIYSIFDFWIEQLDSLGIISIKGNIIADDNYFDNISYAAGWAWDDMIYPYSAQISALSYYDNRVDIIIEQGDTIGASTKYKIIPENSYIRVINNVNTLSKGSSSEIEAYRDPVTNVIELYGNLGFDSIKTNRVVKSVAIDQPSLFFLNVFKERLLKKNIKFRGALLDIDDWNQDIKYYELNSLKDYESPNLSEIIKVINKRSHNLGAEILVKTLGKEVYGLGTTAKGLEVINNYMNKIGIQTDKCSIADGSGLSRLNMISPIGLNILLNDMNKNKYKDTFRKSLSTPNEDGTLKRRFINTLAEKNIFAKTGSMNNVNSLAGYVLTRDREVLSFVMMFNNFTVPQNVIRNIQDLIAMRLASFSRRQSFVVPK